VKEKVKSGLYLKVRFYFCKLSTLFLSRKVEFSRVFHQIDNLRKEPVTDVDYCERAKINRKFDVRTYQK
jgi:hypothetical protein